MSKSLLNKIDRERSLIRSREPKTIEQLCRITLAADYPTHVDIPWCEGLGKKTVLYVLEPGKSIVWPLNRTIAYFGPFTAYEQYEKTTDERKIEELKDIISRETARFLYRYDYPRDNKTGQPIGPHRAPDVSIEVIGSEGDHSKPYRLYELYGIGEFDDVQFERKMTEEELRAHYEQKLLEKDAALEQTRREIAEVRGMILGKAQAIVQEAAAPKAHGTKGKRNPHKPNCQCAAHRNKNQAVAAGA